MKIQANNEPPATSDDPPVIQGQPNIPNVSHPSTLASVGEKGNSFSISNCILAPCRLIGRIFLWIKNVIFSWFFPTPTPAPKTEEKGKSDWEKAKGFADGMCNAVLTATNDLKGTGSPKEQEDRLTRFKRYATQLRECNEPAFTLFKQHIGFAIAKRLSVTDRAKQNEWVKQNWSKIDFSDYFNNIASPVLIDAVITFKEEFVIETKK